MEKFIHGMDISSMDEVVGLGGKYYDKGEERELLEALGEIRKAMVCLIKDRSEVLRSKLYPPSSLAEPLYTGGSFLRCRRQ